MTTPLFPFNPNWARPIRERLEWLTDLVTSKDDHEERTPLRSFPRRMMEFDIQVRGQPTQLLDALLWGYQSKRFVVPVWRDGQVLQGSLLSGSNVIPCFTDTYDFRAGGQAVLWGNWSQYEVVTLNTVGASSITLASPTLMTWPAGTRLYPVQNGRIPGDVEVLRPVDTVAQGTLQFDLENSPVTAIASATTYRGSEVNMRKPNWISGLRDNYSRKVERLDDQVTLPYVDDHSNLQRITRTHRYLLRNRADIHAFVGWLNARMGRAVGFWQPQWQADLTVTADMTSGGTSITFKKLNYAANYNAAEGRRDVLVRNRATGQTAMRRITPASVGVDTETFTLDASLGFAASASQLAACWLTFSRLDADAVELAWHSTEVGEVTMDIRSIRE